jgi:F0F1-type ATP synthase membrane subunit a
MLIAFMFFLVVRQSSEEGVVEKTQVVTEMVTDLVTQEVTQEVTREVTQEVTREPAQTQPEGQTAP